MLRSAPVIARTRAEVSNAVAAAALHHAAACHEDAALAFGIAPARCCQTHGGLLEHACAICRWHGILLALALNPPSAPGQIAFPSRSSLQVGNEDARLRYAIRRGFDGQ